MKVLKKSLQFFCNFEKKPLFLESVPYIHEAIWTAHVQQLIPCGNCGRTFFPDRIKVSHIKLFLSFIKDFYYKQILKILYNKKRDSGKIYFHYVYNKKFIKNS